MRVQIPPNDVASVLEAITPACPLKWGNYEQVVFRYKSGLLQCKPIEGSRSGDKDLVHLDCDEISFTVPKSKESITAVIEAILDSHP